MKTRKFQSGWWLLACTPLLAGCAASWNTDSPGHGRSEVVMPTRVVVLAETLSQEQPADRFEFGRNDEALGVVHPQPLLATRSWPQPVRPAERRIRFSDWQQR